MMQQLSSKNTQAGAYLPLMTIGIVVLLGVAALSIDAANMFYTKLQYKKATDAGVVAALEYRVGKGYHRTLHTKFDRNGFDPLNAKVDGNTITDSKDENYQYAMEQAVLQRAREIARNNVFFSIPELRDSIQETDFEVEFFSPSLANYSSEVVTAKVKKLRKFLLMSSGLMSMLAGTPKTANTFAAASNSVGQISPVDIILLLDISNSMVCPISNSFYQDPATVQACEIAKYNYRIDNSDPVAIDGINNNCYCGCQITDRLACPRIFPNGGEAKLNQLIRAVDAFIERIRPGKDNISIITFNSASHIVKPMYIPFDANEVLMWDVQKQDPDSEDPKDRITTDEPKLIDIFNKITKPPFNQFRNISLGDWTNPADALLSAYIHNLKHNSVGGQNREIMRKTHYILFTDGAPSATRLLLNSYGASLFNPNPKDLGTASDVNLNNDLTILSILTDYKRYNSLGTLSIATPLWAPSALLKTSPIDPPIDPIKGAPLYGLQVADTKPSSPKYTLYTQQYFNPAFVPDPNDLSTFQNFWPFPLAPQIQLNQITQNYIPLSQQIFESADFINLRTVNVGEVVGNGPLINSMDCIPNPIHPDSYALVNVLNGTINRAPCAEVLTLNQEWIKAFFDVPIRYSDVLRKNNGIVHAIGIGPLDTCVPDLNGDYSGATCHNVSPSPYQDYLDAISRKDLFLGRIAGRNEILTNPEDPNSIAKITAFGKAPTHVIPPPDSTKEGQYYAANEDFDLVDAFSALADDIVRLSK